MAKCQKVNTLHCKLVSGFSFGVFQMGACFSKVFDGCPLKINCATSWIHPDTKGKVILGLYFKAACCQSGNELVK